MFAIIGWEATSGPVTSGPFGRALWPLDREASALLSSSEMVDANVAPPRGPAQVQAALDAAVRGIAGLAPVDDVLQVIVDGVRPLVGAQYAALGIVDASGRIERFVTSGMDDETRRLIGPLPEGHGLLGLIIRENRSFRIRDLNTDPHRYGFPPNHPPMTSFLGVPITIKGNSLGRLYLTNKIGAAEFSAADQSLVETFALHAGIAMDNARLHEQSQRLAVVDERERISKDLHDGIIQNMYAVSLSLEDVPELMDDNQEEAAARVERAIDAILRSIQDIRNFIFGLRPELLEGASIVGGLAALVDEYRHNTLIDLELLIPDAVAEPPAEITGQLLAIVSESVSNIVRHSQASRASLRLMASGRDDGATLELTIEDNGVGFDPDGVVKLGHQGLANSRERAARIGGTLTIDSAPGAGTRVIVHVPNQAI
jgi:signal transduction histidine kinase